MFFWIFLLDAPFCYSDLATDFKKSAKETLVKKFERNLRNSSHRKPGTVREYVRDVQIFFEFLYAKTRFSRSKSTLEQDLERVTERDILDFKRMLEDKDYKRSSVSTKLGSVRVFFRFCKELGLVEDDPTESLVLKSPARNEVAVITVEEELALLKAVQGVGFKPLRDQTILKVLLLTGLRTREVAALDMQDVDLDDFTIRVRGEHERVVPIVDTLYPWLQDYLDWRAGLTRTTVTQVTRRGETIELEVDPTAFFVSLKTGGRLTAGGIWILFRKYLKAAGLQERIPGPLAIRHSIALQLLSMGYTQEKIRRFLGFKAHKSMRIYRKALCGQTLEVSH